MDPSHWQTNLREYQRQALDAEIKSLEESLRALRHRRNALAPVSSLPSEVTVAIFYFLRVPVVKSPLIALTLGEIPDHLAWLRVAHVCHHWREIALNQPLFWSRVNFTIFNLAGAAEILARAKMVPLYLEARIPTGHWDDGQFSAFRKELQARASHICHLSIGAEHLQLRKTLEGLVSPAPTLERLSLSSQEYVHRTASSRFAVSVPDTLFDGTTPRLSHLELQSCAISWKSPLLKGLRYLDIRTPAADARPSLSVWLDALEEMPQLKTLTLHSASPIASDTSLPSDVERTITLPSLAHLSLSASARDCGLALAHLDLPALTGLCLTARSCRSDGSDVQEIIPYFSRHFQHTRPLQSVVDRSDRICADVLAWTLPDIDAKLTNPILFLDAMLSVPVLFSFKNEDWSPGTLKKVYNAAMAALPLDSLVTLTSQKRMSPLNKQSWLSHAPRWHLLQRLCLGPPAARGFQEMLLEDNGGRESPLLPSLKTVILFESALSARRTLRLCDALVKRVKQGVPLETLNLRTCTATSRAVELLREIVVQVLGPDKTLETRAQTGFTWNSAGRGLFVADDDSGSEDYEDYGEDDPDAGSGDEVWDNSETDSDGDDEDYYQW
jgi:hypothetical protein